MFREIKLKDLSFLFDGMKWTIVDLWVASSIDSFHESNCGVVGYVFSSPTHSINCSLSFHLINQPIKTIDGWVEWSWMDWLLGRKPITHYSGIKKLVFYGGSSSKLNHSTHQLTQTKQIQEFLCFVFIDEFHWVEW